MRCAAKLASVKIAGQWYEVIGVLAGGSAGEDDEDGLLRSTERAAFSVAAWA